VQWLRGLASKGEDMSKLYKNASGTYKQEDLSVVVWVNPKHESSPQTRSLETITSEHSAFPVAFPTNSLIQHPAWKKCPVAVSASDVDSWLLEKANENYATKKRPVVVPLQLAIEVLGWEEFYIPSTYKEV
jgi:hypothetical protein